MLKLVKVVEEKASALNVSAQEMGDLRHLYALSERVAVVESKVASAEKVQAASVQGRWALYAAAVAGGLLLIGTIVTVLARVLAGLSD